MPWTNSGGMSPPLHFTLPIVKRLQLSWDTAAEADVPTGVVARDCLWATAPRELADKGIAATPQHTERCHSALLAAVEAIILPFPNIAA